MSISSSANSARLHFTATSGQTAFSVSFEFFDDADLDVYVNGTQKTITTDYTVSGGDGSTGTVTFNSGLVLNDAVPITRRIDIERVTDFSAGQAINRAALNTQLDTLTAIASDNKDVKGEITIDELPVSEIEGSIIWYASATIPVELSTAPTGTLTTIGLFIKHS